MNKSKYSIHDLTRCKGEGESNFARFNMPLELGMAMSQRFGGDRSGDHDWLVLVPKGHAYKRFLSDLAGYDPTEYDGTCISVVPAVMAWLATRPDAVQSSTPQAVIDAMPTFQKEKRRLCAEWCGHEPWTDVLMRGISIAVDAGLVPAIEYNF